MKKINNNFIVFLGILFFMTGFVDLSLGQIKSCSFESTGDSWGYTLNPATYNVSGDVWAEVSSLSSITPSAGTQFWGMQDLNNNNGGGNFEHSITFNSVDITGYTGVQIIFKYYTIGFDGNDDIGYQIYEDGAGQGAVALTKSTGAWTTVTYDVGDAVNAVYIKLTAQQNGGSDYAGWDEVSITGNSTTVSDEPTNYPASFTAAASSSSQIDLTWTDASGDTQDPHGYLIKANTTGTFTSPVDGTDPSTDTDLSDGSALVKVVQGSGTYSFSGLSASTQYFFKVWSYTNSSTNIDFKTDGTPPTYNATTSEAPCIDEDFTDFSDWTNNGTSEDNTSSHYGSAAPCRSFGKNDNLVSPSVDYPATLQFYQDASNGGNGNTATVEYRIGAGGTWTSCYSFTVNSSGATENVDLTDLSGVDLSSQQEVYFRFASTFNSWYLDDVTVECSTPASTDSNSEVYAPGTQITASTIVSTSTSFTDVFKFVIQDQNAGDGVNTIVTKVRIKPHSTNTADWTDNIQSVKLNDGSDISLGTIDIQDTYIDINISAGNLVALDDGTEKTVTLSVQLNTSNISDNSILSFMIDADDHGFTTDASGSSFATTFTLGDFNSNDFTITVSASQLTFSTIPTSSSLNTNFTVAVSASDANGNIDTDETSNVSLALASGTGNLSSTTGLTNQTLSSGTYTWNDVQHDTEETITIEAQSSTLTNVTSSNITIATYQDGNYRTTGSGTWDNNASSPAIWEQRAGGVWTASNSPDYTTTENIYIETGHTITTGASFSGAVNIKVNGGEFIVNHNSTAGSVEVISGIFTVNTNKSLTISASGSITIGNGAVFNANSNTISLDATATLRVESGGTLKINDSGFTNDNSIFDGIEDFQDGSTVEILDWKWTTTVTRRGLITSSTAISDNSQGYKFGNLTVNTTLSKEWTIIGGSIGIINLCYNDFTITNGSADDYISGASNSSGTNGYVVNGNLIINSGNFCFGASYSTGTFTHQFTVNGNLEYNGSGIFRIHQNSSTASTLAGYVNVGGNVTVSSSATFTNDIASDNSAMYLNFNGTSTQTLDVGCTATGISMNVLDGATVQLTNNDLTFDSYAGFNTTFTVKTGGTLHFGYADDNSGLKIIDVVSNTGSILFTTEASSIIKITSADGISEGTADLGNVHLPSANKTFNQEATFHYIGKVNQVTGDALENGSTGKVVIAELSDDTKTLTLTSSVQIDDATTVNATIGGYLEIKTGIVTETAAAYFYGDGTITMSGGEYIIPTTSTGSTDYLPKLAGTLRTYNVTGGTIEFSSSDTATGQYVRGGTYYSLQFSNGTKYVTQNVSFTSNTK